MSKHYITIDCSSAPPHKQVSPCDSILLRVAVKLARSIFGVKPSWKLLSLSVEQLHFISQS